MERREVKRAAWTAGGLNALGLLCAVSGMRPGAPMIPLEERLAYLSGAPWGWSLGWAIWFLAALALTWLFATLLWERAAVGAPWLAEASALALIVLGAATDLCCDVLQIVAIPGLARLAQSSGDTSLFLAAEGALWAGGVVCGCGLYCAGILLVTCARWRVSSSALRALGVLTALGGAVWVASELAGERRLLEPATGLTVLAFVGWTAVLPRALAVRGGGGSRPAEPALRDGRARSDSHALSGAP